MKCFTNLHAILAQEPGSSSLYHAKFSICVKRAHHLVFTAEFAVGVCGNTGALIAPGSLC